MPKLKHTYLICLGSNTDAEINIKKGQSLLIERFKNVVFSSTLRTKGIGLSYECWYINQIARIESFLDINEINTELKELEFQLGRTHYSRYVTLDLDLVKIDKEIVHKKYNEYPFLDILCKEIESK